MTMWAVAIGAIGLVAQGLAARWWFKASRTIPDNFHLVGAPNMSAAYSKRAVIAQSVAACAFLVWLTTVLT
jgi:hypothetical protein